jgi:hypothetical protein
MNFDDPSEYPKNIGSAEYRAFRLGYEKASRECSAEVERLRAAIKEAQPFQLHIGAEILMAALNPQTGD